MEENKTLTPEIEFKTNFDKHIKNYEKENLKNNIICIFESFRFVATVYGAYKFYKHFFKNT